MAAHWMAAVVCVVVAALACGCSAREAVRVSTLSSEADFSEMVRAVAQLSRSFGNATF